jgi:hypothetical protein
MAKAKSRDKALKESYLDKQAKTTLNTRKHINQVKVRTIYDGLYIRANCAVGKITPIDEWIGADEEGNKIYLRDRLDANELVYDNITYIKSPEHLAVLYRSFLDYIRESDYNVYPTKINLADYIGISYSTLMKYLNEYKAEFKPLYDGILSDILTEGVIAGAYDRQMTMFCLKNWCNWADNTRVETTAKSEPVTKEKADKILKEYISSLDKAE